MPSFFATNPLSYYIRVFSTLHRNHHPRLGDAPHKPILLLAVIDGIARGAIRANRVTLTPELVATFRAYWRVLVPKDTWDEKVVYPYRYLIHERFWQLTKNGHVLSPSELGHPTSIGQFSTVVDAGGFADDLWVLLQDAVARDVLRKTLLDTYFPRKFAQASEVATIDPLALEAKRLMDEAGEVRFRKTPIPKEERESDLGFMRRSTFSQIITRLYDHKCAVCRIGVRIDGRTLVDAAHIMSFAKFGNDDPRNGLSLCPNHHRGFDAGWFGISDDFTIMVSPRTNENIGAYVEVGASIVLPTLAEFAPERDALTWHRENVMC